MQRRAVSKRLVDPWSEWQAVEKALKAVLAASGDDFPWTHDLRHLMDRLETGVLGIGKQAASQLIEGERLVIERVDGGVRLD